MADLGKNAESRVKRDLVLEKLAEDLKVQVSDTEFNQTMNALAQANGLTPAELSKQLGPNGINSYYISLVREKGLQQAIAQLSGAKSEGSEAAESTEEQSTETSAE